MFGVTILMDVTSNSPDFQHYNHILAVVRAHAQARHTPIILIGGAVRDALLGKPLHDLDIAVQGNAVGLARGVADALNGAFYIMDAERGTARVILPEIILDFSVCRGATWVEDIFARDFTMNAIGYDLDSAQLFDPAQGMQDLQARRVRSVSDHAISDDPVRALRAVRQAHQLQFEIEPATLALIQSITARTISQSSAERLRDELLAICELPRAAQAIQQLDTLGILRHIVPEIEAMRDCTQSLPHRFTVLQHTYWVLQRLDEVIAAGAAAFDAAQDDVPALAAQLHRQLAQLTPNTTRIALLRLATLLHDCGKPATRGVDADGRIRFFDHERVGAMLAYERTAALKLSRDEIDQVNRTIRNHMRLNQFSRMPGTPTLRALYRYVRAVGDCAPELTLFALADCYGKRGPNTSPDDCAASQRMATHLLALYYQRFDASIAPAPLLTGKDLLALGMSPGPTFGKLLGQLREAQMVGELSSTEQALAWVTGQTHAPR